MSRKTAQARAGSDRASLYDEITNKIMAELEAGRVPWVQPWGTAAAKAPLAMPRNAATGRQYSGINVLILWGSVIEHGFPAQGWVTFRQALSLGGNVRKGEHGTTTASCRTMRVPRGRRVPQRPKSRRDAGSSPPCCSGAGQGPRLALLGTDGAEDVGRAGALILGCGRPRAALGPASRDLVLLADPGFVGEPDLYVGRVCQHAGETLLKSSIAPSAWA